MTTQSNKAINIIDVLEEAEQMAKISGDYKVLMNVYDVGLARVSLQMLVNEVKNLRKRIKGMKESANQQGIELVDTLED